MTASLIGIHSEKAGPDLTGQPINKPCKYEYQWVYSMMHAERRWMALGGWTLVAANPATVGHDTLWKRPKADCPIPASTCSSMNRIDDEAGTSQVVTS
ncbi:MAG TPA: hypothetical protein PKD09_10480 [Aggregatilinea sp.]|uniref:hypothetical protein n=1 Tax=Aggregatilinea sp. TaxID=2806333 RepID=UPI002C5810B8|nr:hypothetical protein [Aggregatilinea sp.]HML22068.1 hypothetical protein [Aggregatilinea sp.]